MDEMTEACSWEALTLHGIPHPPKEIPSGRFLRRGRNERYWCIAVWDGFIFGDFCSGLSKSIFSKSNKKLSGKEIAQRRREIEEAIRESKTKKDVRF
jgi:hypothetical protein